MALSGWNENQKIKLTIPAQTSALTDFPVLVNLSKISGISGFDCSDIFTKLGTDSKKIAVEVGDTGAQTQVEVENWENNVVTLLTPVNTDQSHAISASYEADSLFDGGLGPNQYWMFSGSSGWASWEYATAPASPVASYRVQSTIYTDTARMPKDWTFEGSHDNSSWDILDTVTGETGWAGAGDYRDYVCDVATTAYKYYRIVVSDNNGDGYSYIGEVYLYIEEQGAQLWVAPSLSDSSDTVLNFYYDESQPDNTSYVGDTGDTPAQAVWDANFIAVYHMSQDPSVGGACILDSTSNANHGTPQGTWDGSELVAAAIGKALKFDGTSQYIDFGTDPSLDVTAVTLEANYQKHDNVFNNLVSHSSSSTANYDLTHGTDILYFQWDNTGWQSQNSANQIALDTWYNTAVTHDGAGNVNFIEDGVAVAKGAANTAIQISASNNAVAGLYQFDAGGYANITEREVRISNIARTNDWLVATEISNTDALITFSVRVQNSLSQVWAHIIEVALGQHYGDADRILSTLSQHYDDAPHVLQALIQKYDDMVAITAALSQQYNLMFKAETAIVQEWAICGSQAVAALVQEYDLRQRDEIMAALGQYWGLFRDRQDVQAPLFWVMADGVLLNPSEFSWTRSAGNVAIECSVTLPDYAVWRSIQLRGHLEIHWNGTTYHFFIEDKPESQSVSGKEFTAEYILQGLSLTAGLEAPYAKPLTRQWPETTMASVIVTELADGLEVEWQIKDFPVRGGTFNVNNQTPLAAIKALVGSPSVEAIVQPTHDGKLIIRREFPVSPGKWDQEVADHVIYDDGGLFSDSHERDVHPGYNYVEITDQEEANSSKTLNEETISETEKRVRGYSVPWEDYFPLDTSGGSWVAIEDKGIFTEELTELWVEFVDGIARVSKPVYDRDLQGNLYPLAVTWLEDDLGGVTASEDGSLISAVAGNSLAKIAYLTKYREWMVRDDEIESVQVFVPGEEVAA